MEDAEFRAYFREQQVSLQWLPLLRAMAAELGAQEDIELLRQLFLRIGQRLATESSDYYEGLSTLTVLEQGLNDFWSRMQWGWVRLVEGRSQIEIVHHASPLAEAFGDEALAWSAGVLEGYYQTVFGQLGAGGDLQIRLVGISDDGLTLHFEFGL
jgi:hypothetical protein